MALGYKLRLLARDSGYGWESADPGLNVPFQRFAVPDAPY